MNKSMFLFSVNSERVGVTLDIFRTKKARDLPKLICKYSYAIKIHCLHLMRRRACVRLAAVMAGKE